MNPKLRAVQPNLIEHEGSPYIVLRDPLNLSEETLLMPQPLAPLLTLCDGTRDIAALQSAVELYTGIRLPSENLEQAIAQLDKVLLLENERSAQAMEVSLNGFREAECRIPALSGEGYPSDPAELKSLFESYGGLSVETELSSGVRGVISPHIDYERGGPVYAQTWQKAARSIEKIELAIILGTNHFGGNNLFTLTRQNYATPFGVIPTSVETVDRLADVVGCDAAFEDELYHRNEHSIELSLVWLHYILGQRKCDVVPVLCGSFDPFIRGDNDPAANKEVSAFVEYLQEVTQSRRALVVAAADLAHIGPAFGDINAVEAAERKVISEADDKLINLMSSCNADAFFANLKAERDSRRVCGLAPIYLTLRILGDAKGEACGYAHCPADDMNASLVSICGVVLE